MYVLFHPETAYLIPGGLAIMPNHPAGACDDLALTWKYVSSHNQTGSQERVRTPKQRRPSYAVLSANRMMVVMIRLQAPLTASQYKRYAAVWTRAFSFLFEWRPDLCSFSKKEFPS